MGLKTITQLMSLTVLATACAVALGSCADEHAVCESGCPSGKRCEGGECVSPTPFYSACSDDEECNDDRNLVNFCIDSVCSTFCYDPSVPGAVGECVPHDECPAGCCLIYEIEGDGRTNGHCMGSGNATGTGTAGGCAWHGCSSLAPEGAFDCGDEGTDDENTLHQCVNGQWGAVVGCNATISSDGFACTCRGGCGATETVECSFAGHICENFSYPTCGEGAPPPQDLGQGLYGCP